MQRRLLDWGTLLSSGVYGSDAVPLPGRHVGRGKLDREAYVIMQRTMHGGFLLRTDLTYSNSFPMRCGQVLSSGSAGQT